MNFCIISLLFLAFYEEKPLIFEYFEEIRRVG